MAAEDDGQEPKGTKDQAEAAKALDKMTDVVCVCVGGVGSWSLLIVAAQCHEPLCRSQINRSWMRARLKRCGAGMYTIC
jgi:hypothetical protein